MKIVNLETLRAMPEGTLFQKYAPCFFESMALYGGTCGGDFISCEFGSGPVESDSSEQFVDRCDDMANNGASYPVDLDYFGRDGCFEPGQLFAIWEPDDVRALIATLQASLARGIPTEGGDACGSVHG